MPHIFDTDERESIRAVSSVPDGVTPFKFNTDITHSAGNLFEIQNRNSGVLFLSALEQLAIGKGISGMPAMGTIPGIYHYSNFDIDSYGFNQYMMRATKQNSNFEVTVDSYCDVSTSDPVSHYGYSEMTITTNNKFSQFFHQIYSGGYEFQANINGIRKIQLKPDETASATPYYFDTTLNHTAGNLFEMKNNSTTMFKIGVSGDIRLTPITKAMRSGISPTAGTIVYQSDQGSGFRFYDGANWIRLSGAIDN